MHLPRREGGRGVPSITHVWEQERVVAALYLRRSEDRQVQGAMRLARELESMGQDTICEESPPQISGKHHERGGKCRY